MEQTEFSFDKEALRTLTEKYLAKEIFENEILNFLTGHPQIIKVVKKGQMAKILSERAGKSINSIYKNKNEFTNYSAVSFLRYWQAMRSICLDHSILEENLPSIDSLFDKYGTVLDFINQIAIEDELSLLVDEHPEIVANLYDTFERYLNNGTEKPLTKKEKEILNVVTQQPVIQNRLNNKIREQRERMHKK